MSYSVTLELPDELYQKFKRRSQQTKRSLEDELLTAFALDLPVLPMTETGELQAYNEVLEFLTGGPSAAEIAQFRLSSESRHRAQTLLTQEKERELTAAEAKELDFYIELGDFLGLLRAKALLHLQSEARS
ncbi:MAG: hypothetical protein HYR94_07090 [Chloroflexi bacterium]|nr:hypothetical protein [Chloroflexota bacterium]